jgi:hypothetical protein
MYFVLFSDISRLNRFTGLLGYTPKHILTRPLSRKQIDVVDIVLFQ